MVVVWCSCGAGLLAAELLLNLAARLDDKKALCSFVHLKRENAQQMYGHTGGTAGSSCAAPNAKKEGSEK